MSDTTALDAYLTGLRNQHAVETQAIGTIQNQLTYTKSYPDLHARMEADHARSTEQAARLDQLLDKHGSSKSLLKEAVSGAIGTVAGFAHVGSDDNVLKNTLAAIGFKAYEIASYKALIALAKAAGAEGDTGTLERSLKEEQEMGDWLGEHLPGLVTAYLAQQTRG